MFFIRNLLFIILTASTNAVSAQLVQQEPPPYGIAFYHSDLSLSPSTCLTEFNQVSTFSYPTYYYEVVSESTVTTTILNQVVANSFSTTTSTSTSSSISGGSVRHLRASSSSSSSSSSSQNDGIDHENQHGLDERHLQSWCYAECSRRTDQWLIAYGCRSECGLRRSRKTLQEGEVRLEETSSSDEEDSSDEDVGAQTPLASGSYNNIAYGQPGDTTAAQFYATVQYVIPSTNVCQAILLKMTYQVWPLVIQI
jgi:hypothetical protein